jgi:hypothetical protein
MSAAQGLYNTGQGYNAPGFDTYVPMSAQTTAGLNNVWGLSQQGNPLAGQSMGAISGILSGDTANKYNQLYSSTDNPHFAAAVQGQSDQIANDVQRQFGGLGRTGSAADTGALTSQLGNFREQALSNQWQQNVANQRGILSDQVQGQLGAVAAAPGAYQQQYLPAEAMGRVGAAYEDLGQRQLQSRLDAFNTQQQSGWNRLNAYNQAIAGTGGAQTRFGSVQAPNNFFGGLLGGALGGASIGKQVGGTTGAGYGALAGGALGGLGSLFNF